MQRRSFGSWMRMKYFVSDNPSEVARKSSMNVPSSLDASEGSGKPSGGCVVRGPWHQ
jgi:hypothetical protein